MGAIDDNHCPSALEGRILLPDGSAIRVRGLRPLEELPVRELFDHLSLHTRRLRFLSPLRVLPESLLRRLVSVDGRRHVAFVAEYDGPAGVETIGLGSFAAADDERAEVGLVVRDDWQGRRLGSELAVRMLDAAEARGFHQFIAHVASGNAAIRRIITRLGLIVTAKTSFGVSEVVFVRPTPAQDHLGTPRLIPSSDGSGAARLI
jgi:RimJ/RimL family protein N-acetyltransferase